MYRNARAHVHGNRFALEKFDTTDKGRRVSLLTPDMLIYNDEILRKHSHAAAAATVAAAES